MSGTFGVPEQAVEEWSWSFAVSVPLTGEVAELERAAAAIRVLYAEQLAPFFPPRVVLTRVRVATIGVDGRVVKTGEGSFLQGDALAPVQGQGPATAVLPLQTALCVSLTTPRAGASGKGRMFWPAPSSNLDGSGLYSDAFAGTMAQAAASFLSAVSALQQWVGGVEVVSAKGLASPVTGTRVGVVPDTMRSRRHRIPERYVVRPVTQ